MGLVKIELNMMNSKNLLNCFAWNHQHFEKIAKKTTNIFGMPPPPQKKKIDESSFKSTN